MTTVLKLHTTYIMLAVHYDHHTSARPLPKGTVPFGLLMCPFWTGNKAEWTLCQPFALGNFRNHLKYLTKLWISLCSLKHVAGNIAKPGGLLQSGRISTFITANTSFSTS